MTQDERAETFEFAFRNKVVSASLVKKQKIWMTKWGKTVGDIKALADACNKMKDIRV